MIKLDATPKATAFKRFHREAKLCPKYEKKKPATITEDENFIKRLIHLH